MLMFLMYWLLFFISQFIAFLPQMLKPMFEFIRDNPEADQMELIDNVFTTLSYPWYLNLLQVSIFALMIYLFKKKGITFFSKAPIKLKEILFIVGASIGLIMISGILENVIARLQPAFNTENQVGLEGLFSNSSPITMFISVVILAPIIEEVLFRGIFMKVLFAGKDTLGFIVCAVAFTLVHSPTDFYSFLIYFTMALGLGWIYWRTERIEASIFAHFLNNLLAFVLMMIYQG